MSIAGQQVDRAREPVAALIRQDKRETGDLCQPFTIIIMDDELDMVGLRVAHKCKWRANFVVNLAEKMVALP
jgi:hypothetical protein